VAAPQPRPLVRDLPVAALVLARRIGGLLRAEPPIGAYALFARRAKSVGFVRTSVLSVLVL
jgi:hypothetical protein